MAVKKNKKLTLMNEGEQTERKVHVLEQSPFAVIEETIDGKKGFYGVMGKYRLTDKRDNLETCRVEMESTSWNNLIRIISLLIKDRKEIDRQFNS